MTRVGPEWFWQICRFRAEAWGKSFPQKSTPASTFCLLYHIVLDIAEYDMISSTSHQAWLFYSPLALQASLLKDDLLDPVDPLLDDPVCAHAAIYAIHSIQPNRSEGRAVPFERKPAVRAKDCETRADLQDSVRFGQ